MRYWDTSSLVPLVMEEERSHEMEEVFREDDSIATWGGTSVECVSAIRRKERMDQLATRAAQDSIALLDELSQGWVEVEPTGQIRNTALRLLAVHPLIAADALQLAAALDWAGRTDGGARFISLDQRLSDAASREGLTCII